ncbi:hypothetical protein SODALDRAFT_81175 [Sodiomyces alkalinus F11]|uniref:Uncharacterized protein n=1 Tax=Sodiomyces alkalinus (strain CBS 110278 / VKM F-3762 / F11) TaxID=1314773 RepID=A0A3N2PK69_SODAK|nr:hypothetical protein SODALDRAFT_81175 [Sodiomyces alkalinus F11]ROT34784.1 hypothetical protein SODALDRAFT_81175 [Sodiomyces alkalinus F11]
MLYDMICTSQTMTTMSTESEASPAFETPAVSSAPRRATLSLRTASSAKSMLTRVVPRQGRRVATGAQGTPDWRCRRITATGVYCGVPSYMLVCVMCPRSDRCCVADQTNNPVCLRLLLLNVPRPRVWRSVRRAGGGGRMLSSRCGVRSGWVACGLHAGSRPVPGPGSGSGSGSGCRPRTVMAAAEATRIRGREKGFIGFLTQRRPPKVTRNLLSDRHALHGAQKEGVAGHCECGYLPKLQARPASFSRTGRGGGSEDMT